MPLSDPAVLYKIDKYKFDPVDIVLPDNPECADSVLRKDFRYGQKSGLVLELRNNQRGLREGGFCRIDNAGNAHFVVCRSRSADKRRGKDMPESQPENIDEEWN